MRTPFGPLLFIVVAALPSGCGGQTVSPPPSGDSSGISSTHEGASAASGAASGSLAVMTSGGVSGSVSASGVTTTSGDGSAVVGSGASTGACTFDSITTLPDGGQCAGSRLVASPTVMITTPDPDPSNVALAASTAGDQFLALWTDGGWSVNGVAVPESIWASLIRASPTVAKDSAAVELTASGTCPVAIWSDSGFLVAWGDSSGLRMQQLDVQGMPVGSPSVLLSETNQACPTSLVKTPLGVAISWQTGTTLLGENVALITAAQTVLDPIALGTVGPGVSTNIVLAQLQGQTYVACVEWPNGENGAAATAISQVIWGHNVAVPQVTEPVYFNSFLAADGRLWMSGGALYAGVPGSAFQIEGEGCDAFTTLATDACGRLVGLGTQGFTPAGVAGGFFAQSFVGAGSQVVLGSVTASAIAGGGSSFGVLWYARIGPGIPAPGEENESGALSFTTLSWQ